jgi:hypothetical protein
VIEPTRGRVTAAIAALQVVLGLTRPADVALKSFFRDHPELGQNDRAFVAELVFTVLRHLRLLAGKRKLNRTQIAKLSMYFHVEPGVFLLAS